MPEPDPPTGRLVELRQQLATLHSELRDLEPGSPKQLEAQERYKPVHAAVLALAEELGA